MIDFDKLFENYVIEWYKEHSGEFEDVDEVEAQMPKIYSQWADAPLTALGGIAPRAFFDNITSAGELIEILIGTSEGENNPCALLLDRIEKAPECGEGLRAIIFGDYSAKQKMLSINLLRTMGEELPLETFAEWLIKDSIDKDLLEVAIEALNENADLVADKLFALINQANNAQKTCIAEVLVNAQKDERTYNLLLELFAIGDKVPLYAGYIGKYGDERAVSVLYRALDTCNYMEYIEIKNAIERMGGIVDETRDFSEDMYYKIIKQVK